MDRENDEGRDGKAREDHGALDGLPDTDALREKLGRLERLDRNVLQIALELIMVRVLSTLSEVLQKSKEVDEDFQHTMAIKAAFGVLEKALLPEYRKMYRETMTKVLDEMIQLVKGGVNAQDGEPSLN